MVLRRVAVGAMDTHSFDGILQRRLACYELGHTRFEVTSATGVKCEGGVARESTGGRHPARHISQFDSNRLMLSDRLSHRAPDPAVGNGAVQCRLGDSNAASCDVDAAKLQTPRSLYETTSLRCAEQRAGRNRDLVEDHLGSIDSSIAHLAELAVSAVAVRLLDQEDRHTGV